MCSFKYLCFLFPSPFSFISSNKNQLKQRRLPRFFNLYHNFSSCTFKNLAHLSTSTPLQSNQDHPSLTFDNFLIFLLLFIYDARIFHNHYNNATLDCMQYNCYICFVLIRFDRNFEHLRYRVHNVMFLLMFSSSMQSEF